MTPSILDAAHVSVEYKCINSKKRKLNNWTSAREYSTKGEDSSATNNCPRIHDEQSEHQRLGNVLKAPPIETDGLIAHPLGVKPLGNALGDTVNIKNISGLFALLSDEILIGILEHLPARELTYLGSTCRALYAFCCLDELWKSLFLQSPASKVPTWRGSWRTTMLNLVSQTTSVISCRGLYSDVLHRPWQCASLPLAYYASGIPKENAIARFPHLSAIEFQRHATQPFILTEPVKQWNIYRDWSMDSLLSKYRGAVFRAESVDWPLATYLKYMSNNQDESPLYLFDPEFAEKMELKLDKDVAPTDELAYTPLETFEPDLFDVLAENRPNRRWLIIGPQGGGSTFHADPNGTSAWNAVIRGSKYWLMFPPPTNGGAPDIPGVHVTNDLSEVTSPLSLSEYLLTFHEYARRTPGCVEAICQAGEVLYVPAGWYHMVVNLDEGIAVTQNFVGEADAASVLRFLRDRPHQVTGFKGTRDSDHEAGDGTEYELFRSRLEEGHPEVYKRAMEELTIHDEKKAKKSRWEQVIGPDTNLGGASQGTGVFSFAFDTEGEIQADDM